MSTSITASEDVAPHLKKFIKHSERPMKALAAGEQEELANSMSKVIKQLSYEALEERPFPAGWPPEHATHKAMALYDKIKLLVGAGVKADVLRVTYNAALDGRAFEPVGPKVKPITEAELIGYRPSPKKIRFTPTAKNLGKPGEPGAFEIKDITRKLFE